MASQIWRADGLTPASAELELARGRGALMATLSAAYANKQRRFKIHRAHINGMADVAHQRRQDRINALGLFQRAWVVWLEADGHHAMKYARCVVAGTP